MIDKPAKKPKSKAKSVVETNEGNAPATLSANVATSALKPQAESSQVSPLETLRTTTKADSSKSPAIEEAIEIALEAASTAVDSAQEIQRLRSESFKLITETRKSSRLLLYSSTLIFGLAAIAVFGSLVYFKRAMNDLDLITKVNRDSLLIFAGEINGLISVGKKIDDTVKTSSEALQAITAVHADLSSRVLTLTSALAAANASIAKLAVQEKEFAGIRQSLDELSSATRSANARAIDARVSSTQQPPPAQIFKPKPQRQVTPRARPVSPARAAASVPRDNMIRYP